MGLAGPAVHDGKNRVPMVFFPVKLEDRKFSLKLFTRQSFFSIRKKEVIGDQHFPYHYPWCDLRTFVPGGLNLGMLEL